MTQLCWLNFRTNDARHDEKTIATSLEGHYREEHLFALTQSVELYDVYQQQIASCDGAIQAQLDRMESRGDKNDLPPTKKHETKGSPDFDVRGELYRMTGVDLTRIDGLNETSVLKILAETGVDITPWPTEKHFASWLGLCPGNKITGGKLLTSKTQPLANRAAAAFRLVGGLWITQLKECPGRLLPTATSTTRISQSAITATAHKLARTLLSMLKNGAQYVDQGQDYYEKHEKQYRYRATKNLKKRAASLGLDLVPIKKDENIPNPLLAAA